MRRWRPTRPRRLLPLRGPYACGPLLTTAWQPDDWLLIGRGRVVSAPAPGRRRASTRAAAARWRRPAITRRSVLNHARVATEHVAVQILCARITEVLAVLQRGVVHLHQLVLVARIVLRPTGEAREIVIAHQQDVNAVRGGDFLRVRHALERFD